MLVPKILRDLDRNIGLAAFFVMTALLFFQVALRFLVGQSVIGLDELERYLFIALVYLSIAYTERTSGHICFDSFQNALPTHVRRIAKALTTICSLLLFGIALFSAIISMTKNLANKTPNPWDPVLRIFPADYSGIPAHDAWIHDQACENPEHNERIGC